VSVTEGCVAVAPPEFGSGIGWSSLAPHLANGTRAYRLRGDRTRSCSRSRSICGPAATRWA